MIFVFPFRYFIFQAPLKLKIIQLDIYFCNVLYFHKFNENYDDMQIISNLL